MLETDYLPKQAEANFISNPNRFYGRVGEDFEKWVKEFERCARANHWTEERLVEILSSILRDRAADVWEDLSEETKYDYKQLKVSLCSN